MVLFRIMPAFVHTLWAGVEPCAKFLVAPVMVLIALIMVCATLSLLLVPVILVGNISDAIPADAPVSCQAATIAVSVTFLVSGGFLGLLVRRVKTVKQLSISEISSLHPLRSLVGWALDATCPAFMVCRRRWIVAFAFVILSDGLDQVVTFRVRIMVR